MISIAVLLADGEDIILEVGRAMIEKLGYKIMIAKSGKAAVEIYKKKR